MISEKTGRTIQAAINAERNYCIEKHGGFHSHHEAIAVLAEEAEEVIECFTPFKRTFENKVPILWDLIKKDEINENALEHIGMIKDRALEMVKECIQVCAMCDKWELLIVKENRYEQVNPDRQTN